jgi:hypothetical protein
LSHKITTPTQSMESSKSESSLLPVVPARRSLPSVLPPGYFESPDAQPSSPCWGSACPPIRIWRILWPYERLRVKSLSFQNLQQKAKFCCMYCPSLTRTAEQLWPPHYRWAL